MEVVQISGLLDEVVHAVVEKNGVVIHQEIPASLPNLRGDRRLLRDAFWNIVSNAAEACMLDGGEVSVLARTISSGGAPVVQIEVMDSGPGIEDADVPRVFSPGFTTKDLGSGVGLAVAERAISAHYGRILLDSKVGQGTRIVVVLPSDLGELATLAEYPFGSLRSEIE